MYHVHFLGMDDGSQVRSVAEAEHSRLRRGLTRRDGPRSHFGDIPVTQSDHCFGSGKHRCTRTLQVEVSISVRSAHPSTERTDGCPGRSNRSIPSMDVFRQCCLAVISIKLCRSVSMLSVPWPPVAVFIGIPEIIDSSSSDDNALLIYSLLILQKFPSK